MTSKHKAAHSARALVALLYVQTTAFVAEAQNPAFYTSPLDITAARPQIVASAPDRDTGKMVDVSPPTGPWGPQINNFISQPIGRQLDDYWSVKRDPVKHTTHRDQACTADNGIISLVKAKVAAIGSSYSAYDVSCNLATTGRVLLRQEGPRQTVVYQLANNQVDFTATTPFTCHAGHGTALCPSDPHFTLKFAVQLIVTIYAPALCQLKANPNASVVSQTVSIEGNRNLAGALSNLVDQLFLGHRFRVAEQAIEQNVQPYPVPFETYFAELRNTDACTGRNALAAAALGSFRDFSVVYDPRQGLVFRISHPPIPPPSVVAANPTAPPSNTPTFEHPEIATNRPTAPAGAVIQVSGRYFEPGHNFATQLPVWFNRGPMTFPNQCRGGGTDLRYGSANGPLQIVRVPGTAQQPCPTTFTTSGLTPQTGYQFSARDCDFVTCSLYSPIVRSTTSAPGAISGLIAISIDDGPALVTTTAGPDRTFTASVALPANAAPGMHRLIAKSGTDKAQASVNITAAGAQGSLTIIDRFPGQTGCPNNPVSSLWTDSVYAIFGSGFRPGPVTLNLDSPAGRILLSASAGQDGSFCQDMTKLTPSEVGAHKLVAVQNGAAVVQRPIQIQLSRPMVVR